MFKSKAIKEDLMNISDSPNEYRLGDGGRYAITLAAGAADLRAPAPVGPVC